MKPIDDNTNLERIKKELDQKSKLNIQTSKLKDQIEALRRNQNAVLLCDTSGSMGSYVGDERESMRAIDVMNNVLQSFKGAKIYEFNDDIMLTNGTLGAPRCNTNLGRALHEVKQHHKEIILITDGQPDSREAALREATGLKINIIYIGPQPTPQFLKDLANATHGNFVDVELTRLGAVMGGKEIASKIRGFLADGK